MYTAAAIALPTLTDTYGELLTESYFYPDQSLLYVRWHSNLTATEVIRGVKEALRQQQEYPYQLVLNDKRSSSGDWREALPWLQYEWLPQAVAAGLRAVAYLVAPQMEAQLTSHDFMAAVQPQLRIQLFANEQDARRWLSQQ